MRLHNTLTRSADEIVPVAEGRISMYTCGPTVYRYAHIGNLRTFLLADLVRRALEFEGHEVTQVTNITDVGHMTDESSADAIDKMQLASADEGLAPLEIAAKYTQAFTEDAESLGIQPAHRFPKASEHIAEMIGITRTLIDRGHAYEVDGVVYFDVASFEGYGSLSGNTLDQLRPGHRDLETDPNKRHHADFALWKRAETGRLMKWPSPWGEGFPGWHVECSAMSMRYLGDRFDIHTGGVDLIFPHHEDEIAQSEGAVGHEVVSTWVHGGHLNLAGHKISKSTGNVIRVPELAERGLDPLAFRYLTFQTRYRSMMDFTWEAMTTADHKVKQFRNRMTEWSAAPPTERLSERAQALDEAFRGRIFDDLDMPGAVRILNEAVSADVPDSDKYALLSEWDSVLGLDLERAANAGWEPSEEVMALVRARDEARAARDFTRSDELRDTLSGLGLEVMDTPEGTRVRPRS